jgi:hypothetical protein
MRRLIMARNHNEDSVTPQKEFNFEILGTVKPSVNGKDKYQRLFIRRVPPKQKFISLCDLCGYRMDGDECEKCEIEAVLIEEFKNGHSCISGREI